MAYPRATSRPAGGVCSGRALTAGGAVTVVGAGSDAAVRSCPPNRCALQRDRTTVGPTTSYVRAVERPEGKRPTKGSPRTFTICDHDNDHETRIRSAPGGHRSYWLSAPQVVLTEWAGASATAQVRHRIVDFTSGRPPRLLDLVNGRSGDVLADWLAHGEDWRARSSPLRWTRFGAT
jgi:hypothetical protein